MPLPQEFEDAKIDLKNSVKELDEYEAEYAEHYPVDQFFNDFYNRGMNTSKDADILKRLYNVLVLELQMGSEIASNVNKIALGEGSRKDILDYCSNRVSDERVGQPGLYVVETIFNEYNSLSGENKYKLSKGDTRSLNRWKKRNNIPVSEEINVEEEKPDEFYQDVIPEDVQNAGQNEAAEEVKVVQPASSDPVWVEAMNGTGNAAIGVTYREQFFDYFKQRMDSPEGAALAKAIWQVGSNPSYSGSVFGGALNGTIQDTLGKVIDALNFNDGELQNAVLAENPEILRPIFSKWNELSPNNKVSMDIIGEGHVLMQNGEQSQNYADRVYSELISLRNQGNAHEVVVRLLGIQTYLEQADQQQINDIDVNEAARSVAGRFFETISEVSHKKENSIADDTEREFIYQLAEEMGKASASLRVQNGIDKMEMEKLINDGLVPDTDVVMGNSEAVKDVAGAIVDSTYYNAKKLHAVNILFDRLSNYVEGLHVPAELSVNSKDTSLKANLNPIFNEGARSGLSEVKNTLQGDAKANETKIFMRGAYADPEGALEKHGYSINPDSYKEGQSLFSQVPERQTEINNKSAEEFKEELAKSAEKLIKIQDYSYNVKAIADAAKEKLNALDNIKKEGHENSREFTEMRNALVSVTKLGDKKSPSAVEEALKKLNDKSAEYFRTRNVWYRSYRSFGQDRLESSAQIRDWSGTQLISIRERNNALQNSGVINEGEKKKINNLRSSMINSVEANTVIAARKAIKPEDLAKQNKSTQRKIDYHKKRIDIHAKAKAKEDPGLQGPNR